jgi:hypothetical protein
MKNKKQGNMSSFRFWLIVWGMGLAGQLCWNMENQWFNTFVYAKISQDVDIVTWMVILSAFVTTISTFVFGTMSDRMGNRKKFVSIGYIIWGVATILFGLTEFIGSVAGSSIAVAGFLVVLVDAIMSFFGSMGNDSGYNTWLNDHTNDNNKGQIGAALAALPVIGTVIGTVLGGMLVNVGNETVGTDAYNPALDNYQLLFWAMGIFVILVGVISLFIMKDHPSLEQNKKGSFISQVTDIFRFSTLKGNKNLKELLLANLVACFFFIPFNFYFTHMGNWIIYDIGFTAGDMGLIQGIALLLAVLVTIPFIKLINKDKIPLVALISIISNALGLFLIYVFVKDSSSVDVLNLFSAKNIPMFICVFLVGVGYVLITQACMIWVKGLFPNESKGQFEGVRVCFFTLIPMLIGTLIGNVIIKTTAQIGEPKYDTYGHLIEVPQENLFLFAGILVIFTLIPLFFASKAYKNRIKEKNDNVESID